MSKLGYITAFVLVAAALATSASADDVDRYIKELKDENSTVRYYAAEALGELNDTRAIDPLTQVLNDKNEEDYVQDAATEALKKLGKP